MSTTSKGRSAGLSFLHWVGIIYVFLLALVCIAATVAAAFEIIPWLDIIIATNFGLQQIGPHVQIAGTALVLVLAVYLPSNMRIMRIEDSHRDFQISMDDVAQAYTLSHKSDRDGAFQLSSEFDSVRDRINRMRDHPDLAKLEPGLLEVAAQMSHTSRELATVYSQEAVTRAKSVLRQRQIELEDFAQQLNMARRQTDEIQRWTQQLEVEESVAETQLAQLKQDLSEILPPMGLKVIRGPKVKAVDAQDGDKDRTNSFEEDTNILPLAEESTRGLKSNGKARNGKGESAVAE